MILKKWHFGLLTRSIKITGWIFDDRTTNIVTSRAICGTKKRCSMTALRNID